jgi:hypothetical protein
MTLKESGSERHASVRWPLMKLLTVIGLFLDLLGVMILGMGEVMKGAAALRYLKESYTDSFEYDVQQRPWYVRPILVLGAKLGAPKSGVRSEPPPYRAFPLTVYGFVLLIVGFLLQLLAALCGVTTTPK